MFPAIQNVQEVLIQKVRDERVRLDVAVWLLVDGELVQAIINKHQSGVPVRVIGDRVSIFEGDPNTRDSFIQLASAGVPIRLRYHPTWFPEIMHWKSAIFVGQRTVEFGSANYTTFELKPFSSWDFKDETAMFSSDPALVNAFSTMFDRMWADTTSFLDWPAAYQQETGSAWSRPMNISRVRLEPDYPTNVPGMIWSQGSELLDRMIAEIEAETRGIDLVSYRLTVPELTDALIRRHRAGVPVRVFIEPAQYRNPGYPEYWLVGAMVDRLWAAGVPIKQRAHQGLTHMKTLITSRVALVASSNFTRYWQRDHNYFVDATTSPLLYLAMKDRFSAMWNDGVNYSSFQPQKPAFVELQGPNAIGVSTSSILVWRAAPWAVAFDVFMGVDPGNLPFVGRVNAVVTEAPPATYSFVPPQGLQPSTRYYWRIVARTYATEVNPGLTTASELFSFVTASTVTPPPPGPGSCVGPSPGTSWSCVKGAWLPPAGWVAPALDPGVPTASVACVTPAPGAGWVCMNGGWLPPGHPSTLSGAPAPAPVATTPAPTAPVACVTPAPGAGWVCMNGGWLPPGHPALSGAPAPAPVATTPAPTASVACVTPAPGAGWVCMNGGWLPPGHPAASSGAPAPPAVPTVCSTPDPFVSIGGGICIGGGWVPKGAS